MSSKVKIGIAAVIVSSLVALIVIDQKTSLRSAAPAPSETATALPAPASEPAEAARSADDREDFNIIEESRKKLLPAPANAPRDMIKGAEPAPAGKDLAPAASEEYVIQAGDTYGDIAEKKFGDRNLWTLIADANPSMKPSSLRVGRKITIPSRAGAETAAAGATDAAAGAPKTYVVQSGDTLGGISKKLFGTTRHHEQIFEANRERINSPNDLDVGMKLTLPDIQVAETEPAPVAVPLPTADAAGTTPATFTKVHQVQPGEALWSIAEKYRGDRGILDKINEIVKANPDKLSGNKSVLRVGWKLNIPE